ncbi:hypothetical protein DFH06DRAFT_1320714 [Mycena polygramma]|nr:hypothetical protein DFH06DRAFT_1320714 [Mycena polygramma]
MRKSLPQAAPPPSSLGTAIPATSFAARGFATPSHPPLMDPPLPVVGWGAGGGWGDAAWGPASDNNGWGDLPWDPSPAGTENLAPASPAPALPDGEGIKSSWALLPQQDGEPLEPAPTTWAEFSMPVSTPPHLQEAWMRFFTEAPCTFSKSIYTGLWNGWEEYLAQ